MNHAGTNQRRPDEAVGPAGTARGDPPHAGRATAPLPAGPGRIGAGAPSRRRLRLRDDEDAAVVVTVLAALAARAAAGRGEPPAARSFWGVPGGIAPAAPGPHTWWASGLPR